MLHQFCLQSVNHDFVKASRSRRLFLPRVLCARGLASLGRREGWRERGEWRSCLPRKVVASCETRDCQDGLTGRGSMRRRSAAAAALVQLERTSSSSCLLRHTKQLQVVDVSAANRADSQLLQPLQPGISSRLTQLPALLGCSPSAVFQSRDRESWRQCSRHAPLLLTGSPRDLTCPAHPERCLTWYDPASLLRPSLTRLPLSLSPASPVLCSEDEERLVRDLFRDYNKLIRPVEALNETVVVR